MQSHVPAKTRPSRPAWGDSREPMCEPEKRDAGFGFKAEHQIRGSSFYRKSAASKGGHRKCLGECIKETPCCQRVTPAHQRGLKGQQLQQKRSSVPVYFRVLALVSAKHKMRQPHWSSSEFSGKKAEGMWGSPPRRPRLHGPQ